MPLTEHPRLLARIAGVLYLIITACALFAYMYVRGHVMVSGDMAQTGANLLAQEHLYRMGFSAAVIVVLCNPPMGLILYSLLKVVNPRLALLALVFITVSATIEAMNLLNYLAPLFTFSLPEYRAPFDPHELQALARGSNRQWAYTFSVSLTFFGVYCALIGALIVRSKFLPAILGMLMIAAGVCYWINSFVQFLALPEVPHLFKVTQLAEVSLALWLVVVGVNEAKWRAQAALSAVAPAHT